MTDLVRQSIARVVLWMYARTRGVYRRLGWHRCTYPGCETEKVRGYDYCLEHGAGHR